MKLSELNSDCQARLRAKLSASSKINGFKNGKDHPNWNGGIKRNKDGYISVLVDGKYVKRARLVIAEDIGRCLKSNEITHHINGIRDDDRIGNLRLLKNHSEHATLHHRLRKLSK